MTGLEPLVIMAIAGAVTTAAAGFAQAQAASRTAKQNAAFAQKVGERNAQAIEAQAAAEETRLRRDRARRIGATRAGFGAAGVQLEGTALAVLSDQTAEAEEDALLVRFGGLAAAQSARIGGAVTARNQRIKASEARAAGFESLLGGVFDIGETLLEVDKRKKK